MKSNLLFLYTESALHAGTGSSVSVVDLPIQRERTTQYPIVAGSGVKGALRSQVANGAKTPEVDVVFGDPNPKGSEYAGAISVGEARIILFPVRSLMGVFAYVTCPYVIARLQRDLSNAGKPASFSAPQVPQLGKALITSSSDLADGGKVILEEFAFDAAADKNVDAFAAWLATNALPQDQAYAYWQSKLKSSLIVLSDDDFCNFVVNSTEIVTRVRIETATKTVADGALWTQEAVPADALFYSLVVAQTPRGKTDGLKTSNDVANWLPKNIPNRIQLGGDETTGQGLVALRWA
ncbi:MAG: type III-B CRISPR module RAMP protein Cmr4 [Anaerolineae bacterium]